MKLNNPVADGYWAMVCIYWRINRKLCRQIARTIFMDVVAIVGNFWWMSKHLYWMGKELLNERRVK